MPYIKGKFMVALWTKSTSHDPTHCQASVDAKYKAMESKVSDSAQLVAAKKITAGANGLPFSGIFVAPEYYFTHPDPQEREPMDEQEKRNLELKIFALSRTHPGIVIVPGSYFYYKSAFTPQGHMRVDRNGEVRLGQVGKDRRVHARQKLDRAWLGGLSPEYGRVRSGFDPSKARKEAASSGIEEMWSNDSIEKKKTMLEDENIRILRNSTGLYLAGVRYGKYDKQADCREREANWPDDMVFIPGTKDECPPIGDCRFGLEICLDHYIGRMTRRNVANLHFHIVASDSVHTEEGHMAMCNGGYFLHASSDYAETMLVYKDANGGFHYRPKSPVQGANLRDKVELWTEDWEWGEPPQKTVWRTGATRGGNRT
jgi:hypothetical protein